MKEELSNFLDTIGLKLSEEKTKVTHITEGFRFLGYWIIRSVGSSGKMAPKVLIPDEALKKFRHKIRRILAPNTTNESANGKIEVLNWLIRGWCEYYRSTSSPSIYFTKASNEIYWLMAHWLGRKYKLSIPKVMQKFKKGYSFGTKTRTLARPDEFKAKRYVAKTWHNPYTEQEKVAEEKARIKRESQLSYDRLRLGEDRKGWMDLRRKLFSEMVQYVPVARAHST